MNRRAPVLGLVAGLAASPSLASAHNGAPPAPHDLWRTWNTDPVILVGLTLTGWLYARGVAALWQRAGRGRGVRRWQTGAFAAGLAALAVALISPLDALSAALFSAHMVQHLILVLVAAPLLFLGAPLVPFLWALPRPWRLAIARWSGGSRPRTIWHGLSIPLVVLALHVTAMWSWHMPILYEAALDHEPIHGLEHASLLGTALLFWWMLIQPYGRRRLNYAAGVMVVVVAGVQSTALGALMTFAGTPWYPAYASSAAAWRLSPLADQQLAGVLMLVPMGMVYLAIALALVAAYLRKAEREAPRREREAPGPSLGRPGGGD